VEIAEAVRKGGKLHAVPQDARAKAADLRVQVRACSDNPQQSVAGPHHHAGRPANTDWRQCRIGKMPNRSAADERKPHYPLPAGQCLALKCSRTPGMILAGATGMTSISVKGGISFPLDAALKGRDCTWQTLRSMSVLPSLAAWAEAAVL
jgi:hypothetical protein